MYYVGLHVCCRPIGLYVLCWFYITGHDALLITAIDGGRHRTRRLPHNHIAFLKTHKTASSTIMNILLVYGSSNNLTFVLPKNPKSHMLGWPEPFDPAKHALEIEKEPNILCLHSVFSQKIVKYMPKDTFYFTSVRNPFAQLKSAYVYYNMHSQSKMSLSQLVAHVTLNRPHKGKQYGGGYVSNPVMRDLGLNTNQLSNESAVSESLNYFDSRLDLVMVVDYFDESLVLLRDMLGWSDKDMLYFSKNFHEYNDQPTRSTGLDLSDTTKNRERVHKLSPADTKFYQHFKRKLEAIIRRDRNYFRVEVEKLKSVRQLWMEFCIDKSVLGKQVTDPRFKLWGKGAYTYLLTARGLKNQTCIDLAISETYFIDEIIAKQRKGLR